MRENSLCPLSWQHHEDEAVPRQEIARMNEAGVGSFIVESRPHPHYLEAEWWSDLAILINEAKKRGMQVWIFDDGAYPSVCVNGTEVGEKICPPYDFCLPAAVLRRGKNRLTIEVSNTLAKASHDNPYDRYWVQEPAGLIGPVRIALRRERIQPV